MIRELSLTWGLKPVVRCDHVCCHTLCVVSAVQEHCPCLHILLHTVYVSVFTSITLLVLTSMYQVVCIHGTDIKSSKTWSPLVSFVSVTTGLSQQ